MSKKKNTNRKWLTSSLLPMEASGIQELPDGRLLVINDEKKGALTLLTLRGKTIASATVLEEKKALDDLEGVTLGPNGRIYVMTGSASLMRFAIGADDRLVDWEGARGLRRRLANYLNTKRGINTSKGKINVEGLAWDYQRDALLIGLRKPMDGNRALIVVLKNPEKILCDKNKKPNFSLLIRLDLHKNAIRDITNNPRAGQSQYLIMAGPGGGKAFQLWQMADTGSSRPVVRKFTETGDTNIDHAEGITALVHQGDHKWMLVRDLSSTVKKEVDNKKINKKTAKKVKLDGKYLLIN
ncbi:MAG: hypothetical protein H7838_08250 [Magnetococcus sp. DMHC-8]